MTIKTMASPCLTISLTGGGYRHYNVCLHAASTNSFPVLLRNLVMRTLND